MQLELKNEQINLKFPLDDVNIQLVGGIRTVQNPNYADQYWQLNQNEFALHIDKVGSFYATNGNEIEYAPAENVTQAEVELYLNGSVYGAILHQRKILPLHGSSFVWNKQGILLCGESGAGKSSITTAFCMCGADFLTDDVTPIVFDDNIPQIMPLSDRIKLWDDSLNQLNITSHSFTAISPGKEKFYYPLKGAQHNYQINQIFIIETTENTTIEATNLTGLELFTSLRNEIYRWEYLHAMPETESYYLHKLLELSRSVRALKITRPAKIPIEDMFSYLNNQIISSI